MDERKREQIKATRKLMKKLEGSVDFSQRVVRDLDRKLKGNEPTPPSADIYAAAGLDVDDARESLKRQKKALWWQRFCAGLREPYGIGFGANLVDAGVMTVIAAGCAAIRSPELPEKLRDFRTSFLFVGMLFVWLLRRGNFFPCHWVSTVIQAFALNVAVSKTLNVPPSFGMDGAFTQRAAFVASVAAALQWSKVWLLKR